MDNPEVAGRSIRKMVEEITQNLQNKFEGLRRDVADIKKTQMEQERDFAIQSSALLAVFEEGTRESQALASRRALLKKSVEEDEKDLERVDRENRKFQDQAESLEATNRRQRERKQELEERLAMLTMKVQQMQARADARKSAQKELCEGYRKYLGLEITRARENAVKVAYKNLGTACHVILDFSSDECIVESLPEVCLERLNYLFSEKKNFYEFVKSARDLLKQKIAV